MLASDVCEQTVSTDQTTEPVNPLFSVPYKSFHFHFNFALLNEEKNLTLLVNSAFNAISKLFLIVKKCPFVVAPQNIESVSCMLLFLKYVLPANNYQPSADFIHITPDS